MTASNQGPASAEQSRTRPADVTSQPMSHQNSGAHGYEMYPQQFVRLVGCHHAPASALREPQDEKLH
jgi:hypothetical protein